MRYADLYDLFVFDLDGTLADTREDIAHSLNHVLRRLDRPPLDLPAVTRSIGNGAAVLIRRALGPEAPPETAREGLRLFLEHYTAHPLERTRLYPNVAGTLEALERARKKLAVLTNKPTVPSLAILDGLGVGRRFGRVAGGDRFPAKKPDPAGLFELLRELGAAPARTLMVGDSAVDVATARAAGCDAAGVLWGFKPEEFTSEPPRYLLRGMEDLLGTLPA